MADLASRRMASELGVLHSAQAIVTAAIYPVSGATRHRGRFESQGSLVRLEACDE
jgi:hypothetical protein